MGGYLIIGSRNISASVESRDWMELTLEFRVAVFWSSLLFYPEPFGCNGEEEKGTCLRFNIIKFIFKLLQSYKAVSKYWRFQLKGCQIMGVAKSCLCPGCWKADARQST